MTSTRPFASWILLLGDIGVAVLALWLALFVRLRELPSTEIFLEHAGPFSLLFLVWIIVFYIFDLYGKYTGFYRHVLPSILLRAQVVNSVIAVIFFYFFPDFGISPKTVLFLDLIFTFGLLFVWRFFAVPVVYSLERERTLVIGGGRAFDDLRRVLGSHTQFPFEVVSATSRVDVHSRSLTELLTLIEEEKVETIIADFRDPELSGTWKVLYNELFARVRFVSVLSVYEELFRRIPLEFVNEAWILEHVFPETKLGYGVLKRTMDVLVSLFLSIVTLPIVAITIGLIRGMDKQSPFIVHERIGKDGQIIKVIKFRTMRTDDRDKPTVVNDPRITRLGSFLRTSRIDEIPQLWNVLLGDISLIGPRPEMPHFVREYNKSIPFYATRHLIEPGISGWAQINYHEPAYTVETNAMKLSFDLYYLKNRSLVLDLKIALRTIKTVLLRVGI